MGSELGNILKLDLRLPKALSKIVGLKEGGKSLAKYKI